MKKGNTVLAAVCILLGIVVIAISYQYPTAQHYGTGVPGPGLWPMIIAGILILCAIGLLYSTWIRRTGRQEGEEESILSLLTTGNRRVYLVMGILILYVFLLQYLGFLLATFALEFLLIQWFARKKPWITAPIALLITVAVYAIFKYLLNVPIDTFGILTF